MRILLGSLRWQNRQNRGFSERVLEISRNSDQGCLQLTKNEATLATDAEAAQSAGPQLLIWILFPQFFHVGE
jgi:hypothetical protein